jgi:hypothetical protein
MATGDRDLSWYLDRAGDVPKEFVAPERGDWGRRSRDAFVASHSVSARSLHSEGDLRLHGAGVQGSTADLAQVGAIATAWQKAMSATGAALEEVKSLRGTLPADVVLRTALVLNASPQAGSVVLHVEPKESPLQEAEPEGDVPMVQPTRPLADRAAEQLIQLLEAAADVGLSETDALAAELRVLGPRFSGALTSLAQILDRANITLDASWAEPERPTLRTSVNPSRARWIAEFVAGRGLDAEVQTIRGVLSTVSDRERWLVQVGEDTERMDASELIPDEVSRWRVGQEVDLNVRVAQQERPDGSTRKSMTILSISEVVSAE